MKKHNETEDGKHGTLTKDNHAALWHGRFAEGPDAEAVAFETSINVDERMALDDIAGSKAHAAMLGESGIISRKSAESIVNALTEIEADLKSGALKIDYSAEDIHSFIEATLTDKVGVAGKRVHTGRSRNDQIALDERLYLRRAVPVLQQKICTLISALTDIAKKNTETYMPGFTHMQHAQAVTLGHHLCAWCWMLVRDVGRLSDALDRASVSPIGACALAGSPLPLNREREAEFLGFSAVTANSLDTVSDRDYCLETVSALAVLQMHLSRFCEEVVLWATSEFGFIDLSEKWSTGSSIMPQKKNPDFAELIRGRTGKVYGNLFALLTMMKGLPLAYNRDMQEDKESLFSAYDTVSENISVFTKMISTATWNKDKMQAACRDGFLNATDVADYLVKKNMPFRTAHGVAAKAVRLAIKKGCALEDLTLEDFKSCAGSAKDSSIEKDIFDKITLEASVSERKTTGGPAPEKVSEEIKKLEAFLVNFKDGKATPKQNPNTIEQTQENAKNDILLMPGTLSQFSRKESVYDILENTLIKMKSPEAVYKHVARWISVKLRPGYVVMLDAYEKVNVPLHFSVFMTGVGADFSSLITERKKNCGDANAIYIHQNGSISIPYMADTDKKSYLIIGPGKKTKYFTESQIRDVIPVVRILEKSLLVCAFYNSDEQRNTLQTAFSRYVSPDVVKQIMENPNMMKVGGEKKKLSCIFTDIEGFTTLSDNMDPERVVKLLNIYLNEMSQVILSLGGVIDKFEGDAIVAFFGAPQYLEDHAVRCCLAALRMKRMEVVLNDQLLAEKLIKKPLNTRIGINTGDMVVGNIGSLHRIDYTIIGSNVNIASRLENANKVLKTGILISLSTYKAVKEFFDCKRIGMVKLRGVSQPIETYELVKQKEGTELRYDNFMTQYTQEEEEVEDLEAI